MPRITGYQHRVGVHCVSASLRNVLHHYSPQRWSEAMCFGLGAGLNFTYVREPSAPYFLVMGRGSYMESHFCESLGILLDVTHCDDADIAWSAVRERVDANQVTLVDTDMFYLPYMVKTLGLMDGVHFGGHKVVVTSYDEQEDRVGLVDYAWQSERTVTLAQLKQARSSTSCPSRPRNAAYHFDFPDRLPPLETAIGHALGTIVNQMRFPFMPYNGLPAIQRFCRQLLQWDKLFDAADFTLNTRLTAFMMEKAGTGGGCFRNMYSRFLREAAACTGSAALNVVADIYAELARAWRDVAALLHQASVDPTTGLYADKASSRQLLGRIDELENRGIDLIEGYCDGL